MIADCPGIQKLIADVDKFDIVLVYKLDRLSRSQKDTLYLIEEIFLPNNVDFNIPICIVAENLTTIKNIAVLPVGAGIILVAVSVALTMIARS